MNALLRHAPAGQQSIASAGLRKPCDKSLWLSSHRQKESRHGRRDSFLHSTLTEKLPDAGETGAKRCRCGVVHAVHQNVMHADSAPVEIGVVAVLRRDDRAVQSEST